MNRYETTEYTNAPPHRKKPALTLTERETRSELAIFEQLWQAAHKLQSHAQWKDPGLVVSIEDVNDLRMALHKAKPGY